MDFRDQVIILTGGSRGIGAAAVRAIVQRGGNVLFCYRERVDAAADVIRSCDGQPGTVFARRADVRNRSEVDALIDEALERWARIDVLINNAAQLDNDLVADLSLDRWRAVLDADLTGAYHLCKAVLRPMMKARYGRIVNVAGLQGKAGGVAQANYAAAAGGLLGLTRSLAREVAPWGITVNAVAPGLIATDQLDQQPEPLRQLGMQIPAQRRIGQPEEAAYAIAFLASRGASFITGQTLAVDGGWTMT